jgi:dTDP-4-dehydrorhamnose reductase
MKALVIGAAGQLGTAMMERLKGSSQNGSRPSSHAGSQGGSRDGSPERIVRFDVVSLTRADVDLTDAAALRGAVLGLKPNIILNCAAYNLVDQAEDDPRPALDVNAFAPRVLAEAAEETGATLVHYSTDFVFDGKASAPYTEADPARPQSVYGSSKLLGEWFAAQAPRHYVLRVESLFGGTYVRSSIDKIISTIEKGEETRVFVDRIVTPSYVEDVVTATLALVDRGAPYGLYHCVNSGETTWYGLAEEVARLLEREARLAPVKVADVKMRAQRPQYCALSNRKLAEAGVPMPSWQDSLARYLAVVRQRGV